MAKTKTTVDDPRARKVGLPPFQKVELKKKGGIVRELSAEEKAERAEWIHKALYFLADQVLAKEMRRNDFRMKVAYAAYKGIRDCLEKEYYEE